MNAEEHLNEYTRKGFTVIKGLIPLSLIGDLRRVTDEARELARKLHGPKAQRLQPMEKYADDLDLKPFEDYRDLPELNTLIQEMLTPQHNYAVLNRIGVLFEPAETPYCTNWHRDWRDNMMSKEVFEDEFREDWDKQVLDVNFLGQVNCPLYEDSCTRYVPGSHTRQVNTKEEEYVRDIHQSIKFDAMSNEERETKCREYAGSMPRSVQFNLEPGDFALYKAMGWHMGNYVPYKRRATLHHSVVNGDMSAYFKDREERLVTARERLGVQV